MCEAKRQRWLVCSCLEERRDRQKGHFTIRHRLLSARGPSLDLPVSVSLPLDHAKHQLLFLEFDMVSSKCYLSTALSSNVPPASTNTSFYLVDGTPQSYPEQQITGTTVCLLQQRTISTMRISLSPFSSLIRVRRIYAPPCLSTGMYQFPPQPYSSQLTRLSSLSFLLLP